MAAIQGLSADCYKLSVNKHAIRVLVKINIDIRHRLRSIYLLFENKEQHVVHPTKVRILKNGFLVLRIPQKRLRELTPKIYRVSLVVIATDRFYRTRIRCTTMKRYHKQTTFVSNAVKLSNVLYSSMFVDSRTKYLTFELRNLRPFERRSEAIRFNVARILAGLARPFVRRPVWLVGENLGEVAQDNGLAFFKYCIEKNVQESVYYVSRDDNQNWDNLAPYVSRVLRYDSFKHLFMYHLSSHLIVSHGIRDVIPSLIHNRIGRNPKRVIYLQHGIVAMKKIGFNGRSYNGKIEKLVVSSEHEREIFINHMNFHPDQLIVTGLARFDYLNDKSRTTNPKTILVIPTWREWIVNQNNELEETEFYKRYQEFLNSTELLDLLEEHNLILKFFMHIEMQRKFGLAFSPSSERIRMVAVGQEDVRELIEESSLMVTDYSSVAFDFNYLEKPVVFFHFDLDDYMRHRGAYIDLESDLFGDIAHTVKELVDILKRHAENGFAYNWSNRKKSEVFYAYRDRLNSQRIYDAIKAPRPIRQRVTFLVYNIYGIGGTVRTVVNTANYLASTFRYDVEIISVRKTKKFPVFHLHPGVRLNYLFDARRGGVGAAGVAGVIKRILLRGRSVLIEKSEDLYPMFSLFTDIKLLFAIRNIRSGILITTIPSFNWLAAKLARRNVIKIGQEHKTLSSHSSSILRRIKKFYGGLDAITCLTAEETANYRNFFGERCPQVFAIHNGIPMPSDVANLERKVIVSAGRLSHEKGFDLLIDAFSQIAGEYHDWAVQIFGDGPERHALDKKIEEMGLTDQIHLMGPTSDMIRALSSSSIYVCSSRQESFGMSLVEAMSVGLPVISFACSGPREIISNMHNGLLVSEGDVDGLAEAMRALMSSLEKRLELGGNAREYVKRYSLDEVGAQWETMFDELMKKRRISLTSGRALAMEEYRPTSIQYSDQPHRMSK
ncbi:MAG: CDP-glycerol glycerophosphotransferase family protein [Alicyclobacillus herbarius]|uniref:CDP-glycerol glycerophosphotransferase family protein n=1 Tax=Alicyclobacillus herbarius TaxID=122960 RepID=UPI002357B866|nr:CDP-glycerol glycerophosphotransferase family protein [Alicyclobacillus herbarius]MCL6634024.1 CDP-glycerol glycerophosphotransferase family protein [Alicyclobacillus herbarius]